MDDEPRIVATPGTCAGEPRIDGTRVPVQTVVGAWRLWGHEEPDKRTLAVSRSYGITPEQVRAALDYYEARRAALDLDWALDSLDDEAVRAVVAAAVDLVARLRASGVWPHRLDPLGAAVDDWKRATGQDGTDGPEGANGRATGR